MLILLTESFDRYLTHHTFTFTFASVLDLDAFERTNKAKGLGMSTESGPGNLVDGEETVKLFRFLQLLCEGHNLGE